MMKVYHHSFLYAQDLILEPRGNNYKLLNHTFHYDLQKHFFTARIVNIWNSLPNSVVYANSVNAFIAQISAR